MQSLRDIVDEHGELNDALLESREAIYQGRNGKYVERIRVAGRNGDVRSIIFKPLTNQETLGKEEWVNRHIASRLPNVLFPRLLCAAGHSDTETYWIMLEDLGVLEHFFDEEIFVRTAEAMPYWHLIPLDTVPETFSGHTPKLREIWDIVRRGREKLAGVLARLGFSSDDIAFVRRLLQQEELPAAAVQETVVSHGDLYPLNIALSSGSLVILDWEYIHRNSIYWDLYNLIDITSPSYRRSVLGQTARMAILEGYVKAREQLGRPLNGAFITGYHHYCLFYSLWILLLVENDLQGSRFDKDGLLRQQQETVQIVHQMLDYLIK